MSDGELRKIFRKHLIGFDLLAVETGGTTSGVPDMNLAAPGNIEIWVEMKQAAHWRTTIRPMQVGWIERRLRFNKRVFIAVRRAGAELWLYHGSAVRRLKTERLDQVPALGHWDNGPACWGWTEIAKLLVA